jgi:hypothetical protein
LWAIHASFRQRWARLFKCYAWPERYHTNNDLETFFGRLRTRQRQIQSRKSVHEFVIRYGAWAIFLDPSESYGQVFQRCRQFDQAQFDQEHARYRKAQQRLQVLYRFRHRPRGIVNLFEPYPVWQSCRMDSLATATKYKNHRCLVEIISHAGAVKRP